MLDIGSIIWYNAYGFRFSGYRLLRYLRSIYVSAVDIEHELFCRGGKIAAEAVDLSDECAVAAKLLVELFLRRTAVREEGSEQGVLQYAAKDAEGAEPEIELPNRIHSRHLVVRAP